jgi:transposase-like protein
MGDRFERKGAMASQIPKSMRWSYDANFKLMVIKHAEQTNNCATARKLGVSEPNVRRWRKQKELLKGANSNRLAFRGPKHGNFNAVDKKVLEFVLEKRKNGLPVTREAIQIDTVTYLRTKDRVHVTVTFKFPVQDKNKELTDTVEAAVKWIISGGLVVIYQKQ